MTPSDKSRTSKPRSSKASARESAARDAVRGAVKGERLDLLAAALIGAAVGAAAAMMASGPSRPTVARRVRRGARRVVALGGEALERVPAAEAATAVRDYVNSARGAIDEAVEQELRDLRRAVRRQRKRIGV